MRLKSELWVKAYLRRQQSAGAFAAVVVHGHDDAGAILIKISRLDGTAALFGPAPMSFAGDDLADGERRFARMHDAEWAPEQDVDALIARQRTYDGDLWVVEVESRQGDSGLEGWLATC